MAFVVVVRRLAPLTRIGGGASADVDPGAAATVHP